MQKYTALLLDRARIKAVYILRQEGNYKEAFEGGRMNDITQQTRETAQHRANKFVFLCAIIAIAVVIVLAGAEIVRLMP